jgi:anti-sigma28 factor (negative regulator of flagellin synthesis)
VKTQKERAEEKRQQKLEEMQSQIRDGSLVVRKMTPAERERNAPRPPREKKGR